MQYNTHAPWKATSTIQTNREKPPPVFHLNVDPVLDHVLIHSVDKNHALVVTVELIWLLFNILSCNFVQHRTNFLGWPRSLFCSCLFPKVEHLRNLFWLSRPVVQMLLTPRWVRRQKDVKQLSINISNELSIPSTEEQRFLLIHT